MLSQISPYIWAIVITWVAAHAVKYLIAAIKGTLVNFKSQVFISGGMPSSHVATSVALWVVILLKDGPMSGLFGMVTLFVLIVAHDAVRVRRSSGEQGTALIQVMIETKSKAIVPRTAKGHTLPEVIVGAVFGAVLGIVVFLATT